MVSQMTFPHVKTSFSFLLTSPPFLFSRDGTQGLNRARQALAHKLVLHSSYDQGSLFLNSILSEPGESTEEVFGHFGQTHWKKLWKSLDFQSTC